MLMRIGVWTGRVLSSSICEWKSRGCWMDTSSTAWQKRGREASRSLFGASLTTSPLLCRLALIRMCLLSVNENFIANIIVSEIILRAN